jgi:hypothetical protein
MENKILKWAVILGTIIVLNLFFTYALKIIYKAPVWDDFCQKSQVIKEVTTEEACVSEGGQWNENTYPIPSEKNKEVLVIEKRGYCNLQFTCQNNFEDARESYEKNVFITLVILGIISIIIGFLIADIGVVSAGLSFGGVLSFIVASIRYWRYAGEYLQVGILALALITLIWLGVKKFK